VTARLFHSRSTIAPLRRNQLLQNEGDLSKYALLQSGRDRSSIRISIHHVETRKKGTAAACMLCNLHLNDVSLVE
jgi:hypothetical protein